MLKLAGVLLMVFGIIMLFAFAAPTVSPELRQKFTAVFCSRGEQLGMFDTGGGDDSNTTVYCEDQNGQRRTITTFYFVALFASFLVPLSIGRALYGIGKAFGQAHNAPVAELPFNTAYAAKPNETAARFQQQQLAAALAQAERAYQAGTISKDDLEKYRAALQQAQQNWQS